MTLSLAIQAIITGISEGSIYALVALGFNIIYNSTGIINFTQGEFVILGGILTSFFVAKFSLPLIVAFPIAILIVVALAIVFERVAIYPIRNASVLTLVIITIGGAILIRGLTMIFMGKNAFFLKPFIEGNPVNILGAGLQTQTIWIIGASLVLSLLLLLFFKYTITGKAMQACSFNPEAASLAGIHVQRMVMLSFAISAFIGAAGGAVLIPLHPMMYDHGAVLGLKGFAAAVLGGLGRGGGAVIGGLFIGLSENFAKSYSTEYKDAIAILILLLVLFIKPSGILGKAAEERHKKI
jgi:branched-chain amino acid transport system permease protein